MTFLFLAEIITFSPYGEIIDVEHDLIDVEANTEEGARTTLRQKIEHQGRRIGRVHVEAVAKGDLSDSWF
jgi:hypothetical protein